MQYLSGYYWRQEEAVSLVLKHLVYPGEEEPVLFGCMCQGEGGARFSRKLTDWFYREGLYFCKKTSVTAEGMQGQLKAQIRALLQTQEHALVKTHVQTQECASMQTQVQGQPEKKTVLTGAAILCVGEYFALWSSLGQPVYLLNTSFGRSHIRMLTDGQNEQFLCGKFQKGVGVWIPTKDLCLQMTIEELAQCLKVKNIRDEERLEKRLREIGMEAAKRGAEHVSTMLVMTC